MEQLVADHPYFSAARLLLARKVYQQTGNLQHPAVKKALLYADQHHYAWQLITEEQVLQVVENRVAAIIPEDTLPVDAHNGLPQNGSPAAVLTEEETPVAPEIIPAPVIPDTPEAAFAPDIPAHTTTAHHNVSEASAPEAENIALEVIHTATESETIALDAIIAAPETESVLEEATAADIVADYTPETKLAPEELPAPPEIETAVAPAPVADFEPEDTTPATPAEVLPPPVEMPSPAEDAEQTSGPIKIFPMATADEETELVFQPLFTDDYFAYKRLKNPEEADDLNEQGAAEMKSFTSWLRQMKDNFAGRTNKDWYHQQLHRIYEEDEEPEVSETVEKMAMDSIVFNNDIVSETLAEIWVRQQQYGNAIKIYQKLSLLNPDKNAYFAQKILELKSKTDKNKQ
ncbi:hypothetical protein SAMN04488122_2608 [Chitinophaga arvensicola]|uniref:Tetratricopeptide repeat-containing protein n=2 Tax=Chitinophaga arvensicola TaxID=29529 RepID=A0A1I0RCJ1_9BACT|nr:hypothetical protein SAMN04488122_2608 [Chitinophaga arvensicola]